MPLDAHIETPDIKQETLKDQTVLLGISMHHAAMQDEHLAAALRLFKKLGARKVVLLVGSELIRYMLAAELKILKLEVTPDDLDLLKKAVTIGDEWREAPEQEQVIRQMRGGGFPVEVKSWSNFSSENDFKYFLVQIREEYEENTNFKASVDLTAFKYLVNLSCI